MPEQTEHRTPLNLEAVRKILAHPLENRPWRTIVRSLLSEVEALQRENTELRTASMHRLIGLVPSGTLRDLLAEWVAEEQRRVDAKEGGRTDG